MSVSKKLYNDEEIKNNVDDIPAKMGFWQESCFGPNTVTPEYIHNPSQYIRDLATQGGGFDPVTEGFGVVTYYGESKEPQKVASGTLQKKDEKWFANEICSVRLGDEKPKEKGLLVRTLFSLFEDKVISDGKDKIYLKVHKKSTVKPGSQKTPEEVAEFLVNYYDNLGFNTIEESDEEYTMMKDLTKKGGRKKKSNKTKKHHKAKKHHKTKKHHKKK